MVLVRDSGGEGGAPGEKRLNAYLVADSGLDVGEVRAFLRERLPDYMVPGGFLVLDALPLSSNGKVDRRALPSLEHEAPASRREYVAPRTEIEEALATICGEAPGSREARGPRRLFELGGDSLMAIRAIFRIRKAVGVELQVRSFFDAPTMRAWPRASRSCSSTRSKSCRTRKCTSCCKPTRRGYFERHRRPAGQALG